MRLLFLLFLIIPLGCSSEHKSQESKVNPRQTGLEKRATEDSDGLDHAKAGLVAKTYFLYIKIPEAIMPIQRGKKYGDPIDALLKEEKLGEVTGGGTMLARDKTIEYVGIDVDVYDPEKAIPLLVRRLRELGAPKGTVIEQYEPTKRIVPVY